MYVNALPENIRVQECLRMKFTSKNNKLFQTDLSQSIDSENHVWLLTNSCVQKSPEVLWDNPNLLLAVLDYLAVWKILMKYMIIYVSYSIAYTVEVVYKKSCSIKL